MKHDTVDNRVTAVEDLDNGLPGGRTVLTSLLDSAVMRLRAYQNPLLGLRLWSGMQYMMTLKGGCRGVVVGTVDSSLVLQLKRGRVLRHAFFADPDFMTATIEVTSLEDGTVEFAGTSQGQGSGFMKEFYLPAGKYEFKYHATHQLDVAPRVQSVAGGSFEGTLHGPGAATAVPSGAGAPYLRLPQSRQCAKQSLVAHWLAPTGFGQDRAVRTAKVSVNRDLVARVRSPEANDQLRLTHLASGQHIKVSVWLRLVNGDRVHSVGDYVLCG